MAIHRITASRERNMPHWVTAFRINGAEVFRGSGSDLSGSLCGRGRSLLDALDFLRPSRKNWACYDVFLVNDDPRFLLAPAGMRYLPDDIDRLITSSEHSIASLRQRWSINGGRDYAKAIIAEHKRILPIYRAALKARTSKDLEPLIAAAGPLLEPAQRLSA